MAFGDQMIDRAGRDAMDVGLLDHRRQRLLGRATRLEEAGEVAALAQLGDAQLAGAGAGAPRTFAVAVAVVDAIGGAGACRAPVFASICSSIMRSAANASISRTRSALASCSTSCSRAILASVTVVFSRFEFASEP
jgi:hypothetical protein